MTFTKNWKSIGAAVLALAAISSVSVITFAQDAKSVPVTESTPAAVCTPATAGVMDNSTSSTGTSKDMVASFSTIKMTDIKDKVIFSSTGSKDTAEVRFNEKTGKMEISEDKGVTWQVYEGEVVPAMTLTPAMAAAQPAK